MDRFDPHGGRVYAHRRADQITAEVMDVGIGTEGGREIARLPVVEGEYNREESPRRVWDDASPPRFGYPGGEGADLSAHVGAVRRQPGRPVREETRRARTQRRRELDLLRLDQRRARGRARWPGRAARWTACGCRRKRTSRWRRCSWIDPRVHIIGHWTYPAGTTKAVYVVSNAEEVELLVNGRSVGRVQPTDRYLFTFPDVAWQPGEIKAVAHVGRQGRGDAGRAHCRSGRGAEADRDHRARRTAGRRIRCGADRCRSGGCARRALSDHRRRVSTSRSTGPASGAAVTTAGRLDSINNTYLDLEAGVARVAVRATRVPGR